MSARSNRMQLALTCAAVALASQGEAAEVTPFDLGASAPRFVPNPVYPAQVTLYGRLDLGIVHASAYEPRARPASSPAPRIAVDPLSRNHVGLRGDEKLSGEWALQLRLEHSLRPDTGQPDDTAGRFWDARATVALLHREWGRIELGRRDQPAWAVALRGDPWAGNGVASPGLRLYAAPPSNSGRSSGALTYSSRTDRPVVVELQVASGANDDKPREQGGSVRYDEAGIYAAAGHERWSDGSWALPVAVNIRDGSWTWFGAGAKGRQEGVAYASGFAGVTIPAMGKGDPYRREWRLGLARFNSHDDRADWKLAVGWRYRFSRHTAVQWNAAYVRNDVRGSSGAFELGITHSFERDLRYPQQAP